jgi:hypothetical protein
MDISKLNTKDPAERGAFLHLSHPVLMHPMYAEAPGVDDTGKWNEEGEEPPKVGVTVRGAEAPSVQEYLNSTRKARMRDKDYDDEEAAYKYAAKLIVEFHNITDEGRPLSAKSKDDIKKFLSLSEALTVQVTRFAADAMNFFGEGASSSS